MTIRAGTPNRQGQRVGMMTRDEVSGKVEVGLTVDPVEHG